MVDKTPLIKRLEEQKAALDARIKKELRAEAQKQSKITKRRFKIMADALAAELEENADLANQLAPVIEARVKKAKDREFLGLPPLPKRSK